MATPEMVERVARAICIQHGADPDRQGPGRVHAVNDRGDGVPALISDHRGPLWTMWITDARAAIEAMRMEVTLRRGNIRENGEFARGMAAFGLELLDAIDAALRTPNGDRNE